MVNQEEACSLSLRSQVSRKQTLLKFRNHTSKCKIPVVGSGTKEKYTVP